MAASEQVGRVGFLAVVAAYDVPYGVDVHIIKTAALHALANVVGTRLVGWGEVGYGELAVFGKAEVAVLG